jgi:hypothetical protein
VTNPGAMMMNAKTNPEDGISKPRINPMMEHASNTNSISKKMYPIGLKCFFHGIKVKLY